MTSTTGTAEPQVQSLWDRVHVWMRWARIGASAIAAVFVVIVVIEAVRLYQLAANAHPVVGYLTLTAMLAASLLIAIPIYRFLRVPRAIRPPECPPPEHLRAADLRAEIRFLKRYLRNCARNPTFAAEATAIGTAREELDALLRKVGSGSDAELSEELGTWGHDRMGAILAQVDDRADRLIYQESLTVGLATAASPNGTLDAFVMLWRSVQLVSRLAVLYYGRPGPVGTLRICRDVSLATVSAAYLDNISDSLGNIVTRSVGHAAGLVVGPAVNGVTNALVLIRIGYVAKERCRSFRYWNERERQSALITALSATKKVAVGLTTEIFRQIGTGVGALAEATAKTVSQAAQAAAKGIGAVTDSAVEVATELRDKITGVFKRKPPDADAESEPQGGESP